MTIQTKTSPAKISANRRNALRSTGPKTPEGRQTVRWNALKHGLLAKEVLIQIGDGKESRSAFDSLHRALHDDLQPAGVLEEMLVEKIAVCYWRLRRALRFEIGQLRKELDTFVLDTRVKRNDDLRSLWSPKERHLARTTVGVHKLLNRVAKVRSHMETENGLLCDDCKSDLLGCFTDDENHWGESVAYFCWVMSGGPERSPDEFTGGNRPSAKECRKYVLELLDEKEEQLQIAKECVAEREALNDASATARLSLPDAESADRLLRYETTIERQLYRALNQLERLQRQRKGDAVPPPINVELSGNE